MSKKQNKTEQKQNKNKKQKQKTKNKKKQQQQQQNQYYDKSHILLMAHTRLWQLVNSIFQQCNTYDSNF